MRASSVESAILHALSGAGCHLTAHEVLAAIRPRLPAVNPSTVYRALERLAAEGKVSVSDIGQGAAVYERVEDQPHHHLVCEACGELVSLDPAVVERFLAEAAQASGFRVRTNHLVLFGRCPGCQGQQD